ncbi:ubiquitin-conjugating enzyme E2, putative [Phytophthora infestans T30-4]|uniref:Ubiquitin-conjugating enzyme E2, putative n=1 Tax=Phytophthora infestans (strain T30-4) TaxID=403677 RepID=D0MZ87_PHYIT|nr:ubiquitin-conjugating enzyme E2, putative [Phytophthora infestans T30-4]EEY65550.1 ubiquitin-conjugating enzyme E2, putative [Phytophthora infestans T30-4]|eukprot:XP_002906149.1 ubiquitin-conjugating enzyme E2, putative [Phytophthora infestans T30-4]
MRGRMRKEIAMLESDPPFGVSAWPKDDQIDHLEAQILGPDGSPYEKGVFQLEIEIPERYPFEPPKGSWLPSVNISTLLTTIRLLMGEPNADDGLMPEIADTFKHNRELFNRKATEMTVQHARNAPIRQPKPSVKTTTAVSGGDQMESEEKDPPTQDTQAAEVPSEPRDSVSSDDSFSDGDSSSEEKDDDTADTEAWDPDPPTKRRRQE